MCGAVKAENFDGCTKYEQVWFNLMIHVLVDEDKGAEQHHKYLVIRYFTNCKVS